MKVKLLLFAALLFGGFSTQIFGQLLNDDFPRGKNHWDGYQAETQATEKATISTLTLEQWKAALQGSTVTICKNQPVPPGYVIIRQTLTGSDCPGGGFNAWIIKLPGDSETVCKISPIPSGYVFIRQTLVGTDCPDGGYNAWVIKLPNAIETVCKDSSIPSGYVIAGQVITGTDCPGGGYNAWSIRRLANPSASPTSGLWYNPNRSGHGIDISRTSTGQLILLWYTYLPNGQPIWFMSDTASMSQGTWVATLNKVTRDPTSGNVVQQPVGTAELTMFANNELLFEWFLNSQSGSPSSGAEEMIHLAGGSSYTGLWYEPAFSGWGINLDVQGSGASASNVATAYFYTASGQPVWAQGVATGDVNSSSGVTFNMQAFVGTNLCPGCTGQPSTTASSAGTLNMRQLGSSPRGYSNIQTTSGVTWVRGSPSNLITYARLTLP